MLFEGSEKKAEIIINSDKMSFLNDFDQSFWEEMVDACHAKILSSISNDNCTAYLLSESSLFVWHDRILILTCGTTRLVKSVEYVLSRINKNCVEQVIYQRKNEYFAQQQLTSFGDDIKLLSNYISGIALRYGPLDAHHNYVFHQDNNFKCESTDKTYELLAYQIGKDASVHLTSPGLKSKQIRDYLHLDELLPGFMFDDFVFDPYGYSVNAINGEKYLTIHITPQLDSSYVSFEANINLFDLLPTLIEILQPNSFDVLTFNEFAHDECAKQIPNHYVCQTRVEQQLANGYLVNFNTYILPADDKTVATAIDILGESNAL